MMRSVETVDNPREQIRVGDWSHGCIKMVCFYHRNEREDGSICCL